MNISNRLIGISSYLSEPQGVVESREPAVCQGKTCLRVIPRFKASPRASALVKGYQLVGDKFEACATLEMAIPLPKKAPAICR